MVVRRQRTFYDHSDRGTERFYRHKDDGWRSAVVRSKKMQETMEKLHQDFLEHKEFLAQNPDIARRVKTWRLQYLESALNEHGRFSASRDWEV
jgi:hypothetical protein